MDTMDNSQILMFYQWFSMEPHVDLINFEKPSKTFSSLGIKTRADKVDGDISVAVLHNQSSSAALAGIRSGVAQVPMYLLLL